MIDEGRIGDGVALLDEAMALVIAGVLDPYFTGIVYCSVISACLELSDLGRAAEWSDASRTWYERLPPDSPFPGMCRVNLAEVASLRGAWLEAEAEARGAVAQLLEVDPTFAAQAFFQLGEILRRSGDLVGAEQAFVRALELGVDPQPGLALLRLSQGKPDTALTALRLTLTAERQPARRARLLAALAEVAVEAGAVDEASDRDRRAHGAHRRRHPGVRGDDRGRHRAGAARRRRHHGRAGVAAPRDGDLAGPPAALRDRAHACRLRAGAARGRR